MRDATATRRRILAAATAEFVEHGLAGARIDRIAAAARSNKAQLYHYFGGKQALFDAAIEAHVATNIDTVPLTVLDLPGYAARLHDAYLGDPSLVRLLAWLRLEQRPSGDLFSYPQHDGPALAKLFEAQQGGVLVDDLEVEDLWSMLIALCGTWAQASLTITADESDPDDVHERRRAALAATVRRAFCR